MTDEIGCCMQTSGRVHRTPVRRQRTGSRHFTQGAHLTPRGAHVAIIVILTIFAPSRQLMELMGGSCELTSVLGVGSTNTITVKLAKGPEEMASPSLPSQIWVNAADQTTVDLGQSQPRNSSDYRILLAEDNELLRDLITRILRKLQVSSPRRSPVSSPGQERERAHDVFCYLLFVPSQSARPLARLLARPPTRPTVSSRVSARRSERRRGSSSRTFRPRPDGRSNAHHEWLRRNRGHSVVPRRPSSHVTDRRVDCFGDQRRSRTVYGSGHVRVLEQTGSSERFGTDDLDAT